MRSRNGKLSLAAAIALILLFSQGCIPDRNKSVDGAAPVKIFDYGKSLFAISPDSLMDGLKELRGDYAFFLQGDIDDTLAMLRMRDFVSDPFIRSVAADYSSKFRDLGGLEDSLGLMFAHYLHHYPEKKIPKVFAYVSGLHYEQPVEWFDSVMILGLDMFLGEGSPFYAQVGMPAFMAHRCTPAHILPYCAEVLANNHLPLYQGEDLISAMVHEGKRLYFMQMMLPGTPDHLLVKYTEPQMEWCRKNEEQLWAFLVDNELLYSTDLGARKRMMQDGPFTTAFGTGSAPRPGFWVGWMIVRSYMAKHPDTSLKTLMETKDHRTLFQNSGYRPR
ncbi:MAG: hypothetical protein IH599_00570 [Bacteroidales bacterium]|nr:hypothetical protein [Bacteroidales bacterium]